MNYLVKSVIIGQIEDWSKEVEVTQYRRGKFTNVLTPAYEKASNEFDEWLIEFFEGDNK